MTTSAQYSAFGGFGSPSGNQTKPEFPRLRNGSLAQSKDKSPWASSKSIWGVFPADLRQPSSEESCFVSNGITTTANSDRKSSLYSSQPSFGPSPWGNGQSHAAQPEFFNPISSNQRPPAYADSHQQDRLASGIKPSLINARWPSQSNSVDGPSLPGTSVHKQSSHTPWRSGTARHHSTEDNPMTGRVRDIDQNANSQDMNFNSWKSRPPTRDGWMRLGPPRQYASDMNMLSRASHGNTGMSRDDTELTAYFERIRFDKTRLHNRGEMAPLIPGGRQHSPAVPFSNGYQSKEAGHMSQVESFSGALTSGGSREDLALGNFQTFRLFEHEEFPTHFERSQDRSRSNCGRSGASYDRTTTLFMNRPTESLVDQRSRTRHCEYEDTDMSLTHQNRASHLRQRIDDTLSTPYRRLPDPPYRYDVTPGIQMPGMPIYFQMPSAHSVMLPNIGPPRFPEVPTGHTFRSALLEEFKSNNKSGRRYELRDIYDHVVEFSGDQNGSRFIQDKLITANSEEKNRVFHEILPNALQLMMDVFGNYVIQRFFERGDQTQKRILVSKMKGQMLALSNHVYGCRVVQSALHYVLVDQQVALVKELESENNVLKCVRDQNGNHVIQAAIEHVPSEHIQFIINPFIGQIQQLATHAYGCRVVQRLLKYWSEPGRSSILREVHACSSTLISDQYGNYVIQYMLENEAPQDRDKIINVVRADLVAHATQKFASNVVERCFSCGTEEQRRDMMLQLSAKDDRGETPLTFMIKDAYGNYVIQTLLDTLQDSNYAAFVNILNPEIARARRFVPNKQAENVAKKMHRLDKKCEHERMYSSLIVHPFHPRSSGITNLLSTIIPTPRSTSDGKRTPLSGSFPNTDERLLGV